VATRKSALRSDLSKTNLDDSLMAKVTGSNPVGCLSYPPSVNLSKVATSTVPWVRIWCLSSENWISSG